MLREQEPGRWTEPARESHGVLDGLLLFVRLFDGREWQPIARVFDALQTAGRPVHASLAALLAR